MVDRFNDSEFEKHGMTVDDVVRYVFTGRKLVGLEHTDLVRADDRKKFYGREIISAWVDSSEDDGIDQPEPFLVLVMDYPAQNFDDKCVSISDDESVLTDPPLTNMKGLNFV